MRFPRLVAPLAALLLVAGCGSDSKDKTEKTATPQGAASATPDPADAAGCRKVDKPKPKGKQKLAKPSLKLSARQTYIAVVRTSCGEFAIRLDVKRAPKTASSFVALAKLSFFDSTTFHRVVPGFVIQGGDPLGNGQGGPGFKVTEEPPRTLKYTRGVVAMAKSGAEPPGTSGSQFFVVTGEDVGLPPDYALLGKVTRGQDVVDTIGTVATDPATEAPAEPVVIESVRITEK